ncbi:hypothetical protein RM530_03845 [Algiphilus sp. W345]|uniref:Gag protein n=1 Tax=Banduia mediterranea TaxID=3075609 RepID=A0ABU2WG58_9GAMM|nr:hypothetical protein [Algiphilus sp. W345]MDT0496498.1 hypothetical protein [Algiphilus sp. W345]
MTTCICPTCGTYGPLPVFSADPVARQYQAQLAKVPAGLGPLVMEYMGLFMPRKRALTWPRALRLLQELSAAIHAQSIEYRGHTYPAPPESWSRALRQMLDHIDRLTLPMESHGYLVRILVGLHERSEDRAERDRDAELRAGQRRDSGPNVMIGVARQVIAERNVMMTKAGKPPLNKDQEARIWRDHGVEPPV